MDDRIERLKRELLRRGDELRTAGRRSEVAVELAKSFGVHDNFVVGLIEDLLGPPIPDREVVERSQRETLREFPSTKS